MTEDIILGKDIENIQYIEELRNYIDNSPFSRSDICIVGSSIMAYYGLRKNNDLDITILPNMAHNISDKNLPEHITTGYERYNEIGVCDRELINDDSYHVSVDDFKIARIELSLSYKYFRNWEKDEKDIEIFDDYLEKGGDFDWELFYYDYYPDDPSVSLAKRVSRTLEEEGFKGTIAESGNFLQNYIREATFSHLKTIPALSGSVTETSKVKYKQKKPCFIIWPSVVEYTEDIVNKISNDMCFCDSYQIKMEDNLDGVIEYLYSDSHVSRWMIELKKHRLGKYDSQIAIIECGISGQSSFEDIIEIKREIREVFYPELGDGSYHMIIHGPETSNELKEMEHLYNILIKQGSAESLVE